jgi:hypothetical protein
LATGKYDIVHCDLCNKVATAVEITRIPLNKLQQAVRDGFNPFKTPGIDMSATAAYGSIISLLSGVGDASFQAWRQAVLTDTTDWGLCSACAESFRRATSTKSRDFEGASLEEAKAVATNAIPEGKLVDLIVRQDVAETKAEGKGKDTAEAIQDARSKVSPKAFGVGAPQTVQEGGFGAVEVHAHSELEVRDVWKERAPKGASLEELQCILAPKAGFLGIGRKRGTWRARWSTPFIVHISYKVPAVVTARYEE